MLPSLFALLSSFVSAATPTASGLEIRPCEFNEQYQFNHVQCQIELANRSDKPIKILEISPVSKEDTVSSTTLTIAAGATAYVETKLFLTNRVGHTTHYFNIKTDEEGKEKRSAAARGFVNSILDEPKAEMDFGVVDLTQKTLPHKEMTLSSREVEKLEVMDVLEKPDYLDVVIGKDKKTIHVSVKSSATWGLHEDFIKLKLSTSQQPQAWVLVKVDAHGEVVPASNPFNMGLIRQGNKNEAMIRLTHTGKKKFKLGKVELKGADGSVENLACQPREEGCQMLKFTVGEKHPTDKATVQIFFEVPEYPQACPILDCSLYRSPDTKIYSLEEEAAKQANERNDSTKRCDDAPTMKTVTPNITQSAIKQAIKTSLKEIPPGDGPLLKWQVANEQLIYGYAIYRAVEETGPFLRVNKDTLLAEKEEGSAASSYQWRDTKAESGKTYWYYIGVIYNDGHKQQLSGAQKITAK